MRTKPFNVDDDETNFSFPLNARFIHKPVHCARIHTTVQQHNKDKLRCDDVRKSPQLMIISLNGNTSFKLISYGYGATKTTKMNIESKLMQQSNNCKILVYHNSETMRTSIWVHAYVQTYSTPSNYRCCSLTWHTEN